jgi:hypothetical protein
LLAQPLDEENIILTKPVQRLHELYQGAGMGSELASSRNTAGGWSMRSLNTWITTAVPAARITGSIPPGLVRVPNSNPKP